MSKAWRGREGDGVDDGFDEHAPWPGKRSAMQRRGASTGWPGKRTVTQDIAPTQRSASARAPASSSPPPTRSYGGLFSGLVQQKSGGDGQDVGAPPSFGGGTALPADVRTHMETALGGEFSSVRIHEHAYAAEIGAQAFTRGSDIVFAPGHYDPSSQAGLALLGHELTHVVQQAQGRVQATAQVGGLPANDDAGLEAEADEMGMRAAKGTPAASPSAPPAPVKGGVAQAKPAMGNAEKPSGNQPRVDDAERGVGADASSGPPIQKSPNANQYVPFKITVSKPMTRAEFEAAANLQVFGVADVRSLWSDVKDSYTPADSPVEVLFSMSLLQRVRGAANAGKGIATDTSGKVAGADARAKEFLSQPTSNGKSAIMDEIDRRYRDASGSNDKIKSNETGKKALWNSIRDEVLFQDNYIKNLPDKVKLLIHTSIKGRDLTPADYDQLFRIAKKIEALPPGAAADYASKITGTTTDLTTFETAVDVYTADRAGRDKEDAERTEVTNKLLGLEEVYKLYRRYITMVASDLANPAVGLMKEGLKRTGVKVDTAGDLKKQLEDQLPKYGFATIADFEAYIARFITAFETGAVRIVQDLLHKYAGKLYKEQARYSDPAVIKTLHGRLAGFRAQYQDFATNAKIWNDYAAKHNSDSKQEGLPGNGGIHAEPPTPAQSQALEKAKAAKAGAVVTIRDLSAEYPIFAEDDLPEDKRLDKEKLAQADESTLGGVIIAHIASRQKVVTEAQTQLEGNHDLIYKMTKMLPTFYTAMDVVPGSIHDQIIQDKMRDDAIKKIVTGILLAIVAIALTVVSLGAATPAVIAAGASIGAAGLSTYMAYDEYKQYTADKAMADAGFADDPSVIWLVLAIVGAGVDMGAAVKAVRALAPAAKALEAGGDVANFAKAVKVLEEQKQIDQKIAQAAEKAAAARKAYAAAKGDLTTALSKVYSLPGPFTDPDVYFALVKMAAAKLREGGHSLVQWVEELKQARLAQKLGALTEEELAKVKQAWTDAERLNESAKAPVDIMSKADGTGKVIGRYQHGSQLEIISNDVKLHGGNTIKLDADATTTVTGTLDDTNAVARRGERLPGATQVGENPGGVNILRSPEWKVIQDKYKPMLDAGDTIGYWKKVTNEFWETVNKPWLDDAMARGDKFRLISNPADERALFVTDGDKFVLDAGNKIRSIFGREVDYLASKGYKILADGTAVKAP
jgi:hypothetical protein